MPTSFPHKWSSILFVSRWYRPVSDQCLSVLDQLLGETQKSVNFYRQTEPIKICFFYSKSHCCSYLLNCSVKPVKPPVVWREKESAVKQKLKEIKKKEGEQPLSGCWSSISLITPLALQSSAARAALTVWNTLLAERDAQWVLHKVKAETAEPLSGGRAKSPRVFLNRFYLRFCCSRLWGSDFFKVPWKFRV